MKKFTRKAVVFVLAICAFLVPVALYASEVNVTINNAPVYFADQGPVIVGDRVLVPVRGVFEALGFRVDWHQPTMTATLTRYDYVVVISVGSLAFTTNDERLPLDVPAQIIEGRTLLPIRAVLESVGYDVNWIGSTNTVSIISVPRPAPVPTPVPVPAPTPAPTPAPVSTPFAASEFELRAFELVNNERARHGLPALIWCDDLARAAMAHSIDMAANNFADHTGSDGSNPSDRIDRAGIPYLRWAENISVGMRSADAAMSLWMESPTHRGNILFPEITHIGVGFYQQDDSHWRFFATKKFIRAVD